MTSRDQTLGVPRAAAAAAYPALVIVAAVVVRAWGNWTGAASIDPFSVLVLTLAFMLTRGVSTRLPQGDEVCVDQMVGLTGLWLVSIETVLLSVIVAGIADVVSRLVQGQTRDAVPRMLDIVRRAAVIALLSPIPAVRSGAVSDATLVPVLAVGLVYVALDVVTVAAQQRLFRSGDDPRGLLSAFRQLSSIYLVHVAMAAVVIRVYPNLGFWAFFIALLLTLILQNGLNLYLRIRRAYSETIGALAQAAELDRPGDAGHARRVADLSIAVGRRLGVSGRGLERIGYAALLHDVGRIGHHDSEVDPSHAARGAQIVESIPFLESVAPLISAHHQTPDLADDQGPMLGAVIIGVCSDFDRLRTKHGSTIALQRLSASETGSRAGVITELIRVVSAREAGV